MPCRAPFSSVSPLAVPASRRCVRAGRSYSTQWTQSPDGASGSSTTTAIVWVFLGTPVHPSGGDWSAPVQVYAAGIVAPAAKAELFRWSDWADALDSDRARNVSAASPTARTRDEIQQPIVRSP